MFFFFFSIFVHFIERTKEEEEEEDFHEIKVHENEDDDFHEIKVHENQSTTPFQINNSQVMVYEELLVAQVLNSFNFEEKQKFL